MTISSSNRIKRYIHLSLFSILELDDSFFEPKRFSNFFVTEKNREPRTKNKKRVPERERERGSKM